MHCRQSVLRGPLQALQLQSHSANRMDGSRKGVRGGGVRACACWDIGIRSEGILEVRANSENRTEEREGERPKEINQLFFLYRIDFKAICASFSLITCTSVVCPVHN